MLATYTESDRKGWNVFSQNLDLAINLRVVNLSCLLVIIIIIIKSNSDSSLYFNFSFL